MGLQAIQYERGRLKLLDQRRLPLEETWLSIDSVAAAWSAIKDMVVRGAPAIAIAAALALAAELVASGSGRQFSSADAAAQHIKKQLDYLVTRYQTDACSTILTCRIMDCNRLQARLWLRTWPAHANCNSCSAFCSRPTAVNLADAAEKLSLIATKATKAPKADASSVVLTVVDKCEIMLKEDVQANKVATAGALKTQYKCCHITVHHAVLHYPAGHRATWAQGHSKSTSGQKSAERQDADLDTLQHRQPGNRRIWHSTGRGPCSCRSKKFAAGILHRNKALQSRSVPCCTDVGTLPSHGTLSMPAYCITSSSVVYMRKRTILAAAAVASAASARRRRKPAFCREIRPPPSARKHSETASAKTRVHLQNSTLPCTGARLTAYELMHDGLPATLICDSAAAALMAQGKVDAIVVGADRVAANGDTANKIGTYSLAVLAKHHK